MLDPFGVPGAEGAFFVPVCVSWLPWGTEGFGMGCFGCAKGLVAVSPLHWCPCLWVVWCVSGVVDRDVRLRLVLLGMLGCIWFYLV